MTTLRRADGHPVVLVPGQGYLQRLHYKLRRRAPHWVLYNQTTVEYPGSFVARMWVARPRVKPTRFVITHDTIEELRGLLPEGLVRMERHPQDPTEILESWI